MPEFGFPTQAGWYWRRRLIEGGRGIEQVVEVVFQPTSEGEIGFVYFPNGSCEDLREPTSPDVTVEWYGPIPSPWEVEDEPST